MQHRKYAKSKSMKSLIRGKTATNNAIKFLYKKPPRKSIYNTSAIYTRGKKLSQVSFTKLFQTSSHYTASWVEQIFTKRALAVLDHMRKGTVIYNNNKRKVSVQIFLYLLTLMIF